MNKILVFEPSPRKREALTRSVRRRLIGMDTRHMKFVYFNPRDVFTKPMPKTALAAFFTLDSMDDAEAARKLGHIRMQIPIIVVSDSAEYGLESWSFGTTRYYLLRPFKEEAVSEALARCVRHEF
jgi:hypothetical protein